MIPTNSAWHEKRETKIGDFGELLIREYFEQKGCICYKPVTDGAHLFDFLMLMPNKKTIAVEVKTKPSRTKYPDTGFNLKQYNGYKKFTDEHNVPIFIFFVDENKGAIYGNYLHELDKPRVSNGIAYPFEEPTRYGQTIKYYPLEAMLAVRELTCNEISELKRLRGEEN